MRPPLPPVRGLPDARRVLVGRGWTVEPGGRARWYVLKTPGSGAKGRLVPRMEVIRLAEKIVLDARASKCEDQPGRQFLPARLDGCH